MFADFPISSDMSFVTGTTRKIRPAPWPFACHVLLLAICFDQAPTGALRSKIELKARELSFWSTNPEIVAAVKLHNANLEPKARAMTNAKWQQLTLLDPFVSSFTKNSAARILRAEKPDWVTECILSGADGTKVAFLSKPSWWSHADKDKHRVPMTGALWMGPAETDDSTGMEQVQIGLPVLDGDRPIGSIVFGINLEKLK